MFLEVPIEKQLKILIREIKQHGQEIDMINKENAGKKLPEINHVKLVRVFLKCDDYAEAVKECVKLNEKHDGEYRLQFYRLI